MNKLIAELQRLYFLPEQCCRIVGGVPQDVPLTDGLLETCFAGQARVALPTVEAKDSVRCAVLQWTHSQDWPAVGALHQAVVEELGLPAPAIAVAARSGFQMWFSFEHPMALADAQAFLDALCRDYLAELPAGRVRHYPDAGAVEELPPALDETVERWSAFIDPTMGSMFVDEGGLDIPPNPDRQADLLAGVESIGAADFQRAMETLRDLAPEIASSGTVQATSQASLASGGLSVGGGFDDPRRFLLAVMNDTQAAAEHRIEAAKALLPYFKQPD